MAAGAESVKSELASEFEITRMHEGYDTDLQAKVISFTAEGRNFAIRVSDEFDEDYGCGQVNVDLEELGRRLRASKQGKATIRRSGISVSD